MLSNLPCSIPAQCLISQRGRGKTTTEKAWSKVAAYRTSAIFVLCVHGAKQANIGCVHECLELPSPPGGSKSSSKTSVCAEFTPSLNRPCGRRGTDDSVPRIHGLGGFVWCSSDVVLVLLALPQLPIASDYQSQGGRWVSDPASHWVFRPSAGREKKQEGRKPCTASSINSNAYV